jgi:carboxypeptidase C (cathepsin A)
MAHFESHLIQQALEKPMPRPRSASILLLSVWATISSHALAEAPGLNPIEEAARAGFASSLIGKGQRTTEHSVSIRGQRIDYTALVSGTVIQDDSKQASAIFVAAAYLRKGITDVQRRPVLFAFNGGPSAASWGLHFGVLGPRILATDSDGRTVEPERLVDNASSVLDRTDLVMVDPVGTGYSVPVGGHPLKDFYSINSDADSVARFIKAWLTDNGRVGSPIYILGESYGTVRGPVTTNDLQATGVTVAGQIYIAPAMNGETIWETPSHLEPFFFYFPAYAVIANYHHRTAHYRTDVKALWQEAGQFAMGEYLSTLFAWPEVSQAQKNRVLDKLNRYTGIERATWEKNDLRLGTAEFSNELLKNRQLATAFGDARRTRPAHPADSENHELAPSETYIDVYMRTELGLIGAPLYREMAPGAEAWNWMDHGLRERDPKVPSYQDFLIDLANSMRTNPKMRVMQNSGMYDLMSNAFPADWALRRMRIAPELRRQVRIFDYESGHAVFASSPAEFQNFTRNLANFLSEGSSP